MANIPTADRFWAKVKKGDPGEYWPFIGHVGPGGYGAFSLSSKPKRAHRVAWLLTYGPIPQGEGYHGMCVLHRCDFRACCNPTHLFLGTQAQNNADRSAKGRSSRGHPTSGPRARANLTEDQVRAAFAMRASGILCPTVARHFSITVHQMRDIWRGRCWAHLGLTSK
jgi:hypothetical protein